LAFSDFNQDQSISLHDDPATPESELEITLEAHYYPFGMGHLGPWYESVSPENKYLYNGKELNDEEGVGLYDFGFRWYDAAYGRFVGVDPIAEEFPWVNGFNYAENEPVANVDLHGLQRVNNRKKDYYQLNTDGRMTGFALKHPAATLSIGVPSKGSTNISTNSVRFSTRIGLHENEAKEGSQVNAFRHVLWQANIAAKHGAGVAKKIGDAHEINPNAAARNNLKTYFPALAMADETVDLLNNIIGRSIGEANPDANMQELALETLHYFKEQGLWTAAVITDSKGNLIGWRIEQTKLTQEGYDHAKGVIEKLNAYGFTKQEQQDRNAKAKKKAESWDRGPKW
jgi:RHS repeat-associated protein